jgi:hypothetical protein
VRARERGRGAPAAGAGLDQRESILASASSNQITNSYLQADSVLALTLFAIDERAHRRASRSMGQVQSVEAEPTTAQDATRPSLAGQFDPALA